MPLGFSKIGNAAEFVGQTSRSARVLQDPLFRPTWTILQDGPQDWGPAPN